MTLSQGNWYNVPQSQGNRHNLPQRQGNRHNVPQRQGNRHNVPQRQGNRHKVPHSQRNRHNVPHSRRNRQNEPQSQGRDMTRHIVLASVPDPHEAFAGRKYIPQWRLYVTLPSKRATPDHCHFALDPNLLTHPAGEKEREIGGGGFSEIQWQWGGGGLSRMSATHQYSFTSQPHINTASQVSHILIQLHNSATH